MTKLVTRNEQKTIFFSEISAKGTNADKSSRFESPKSLLLSDQLVNSLKLLVAGNSRWKRPDSLCERNMKSTLFIFLGKALLYKLKYKKNKVFEIIF